MMFAFETLQPRALGFLNIVDPLDTVSNCCVLPNPTHTMEYILHTSLIQFICSGPGAESKCETKLIGNTQICFNQ